MVVDGNEADAEEWKNVLQIIAHFKIITTETGQILHDDAGDFALLCQLNHALKIGTGEVRTGEAVIAELHTREVAKFGSFIEVPRDKAALSRYTVALVLGGITPKVYVFLGKP